MSMRLLEIVLALASLWLISGATLNLTKHPHWYIRMWDFPRVLVAVIALALAAVFGTLFHRTRWEWALLAGLALVIARQLYMIFPYTRLARKYVKRSDKPWGDDCLRLVISNVLQENNLHQRWLQVVREADPDVIAAVEVSDDWAAALSELQQDYPFHLSRPQNNYYGMAIYSRLAFEGEPDVRYVVQDDVPSMHVTLKLRDGQRVRLHVLHPRPPEPMNDQDSAARDAELVLLAKQIGEHQRTVPTIVCGDLNDVAWSFTTQLFLRLSGLLDPRKGRGQYNSFNAKSRVFRFPLDHVFHSNEFKLIKLKVLSYVGSDHFPMLIELSCQPQSARRQQPDAAPSASDHEDAAEIIDEQSQRETANAEQGHVSEGRSRG